MIPTFPRFIELKPELKPELDCRTAHLKDYSDTSVAAHLSWDLCKQARVSVLHENVIFDLAHSPGNQQFATIQGTQFIDETIDTVSCFMKHRGRRPQIELVPEETVEAIKDPNQFVIKPDRNNFDYVLSVPEIASLEGPALRNVRRKVNRFLAEYPESELVDLDLNRCEDVKRILGVFAIRQSQSPESSDKHEFTALQRLLRLRSNFELATLGISIDDELQAFIIVEKNRQSVLGHFWKANTNYPGIYAFLMHKTCKFLAGQGHEWINIEEDLGLSGLRQSKSYFNPTFLKKYTISPRALQSSALEAVPTHAQ